ncbi:MAG: protein kinase [Candidatus Pacebacteria bacterium]|nr:protein kinase [Candidatus Paceibacterota bacterium]
MPPIITPQSIEKNNKDDELESLLTQLPKELRSKWEDKAYNLNVDEAILLIRKVLSDRGVAKETMFTEIGKIEDPVLKEEVRVAVKTVEGSFGNPSLFVGNGSVAEVYEIPEAPHVCVKYLVNPLMAKEHGNNFREESQYLDDMNGFVVDGIRVPNLLFYHTSDFGTCFGMEKINGKSINLIAEKPESVDYLDVIKRQNMMEVISRMRNFIMRMHKEKKIVHRDLTARNIMVDKNGDWYVIDFGKAKRIEIGDDSTDLSENSDASTVENAIRGLFAKIS